MACGPVAQIINIIGLAIIACCIGWYLYPSWDSVLDGSFFTADVGQVAQAVGGIGTIVALVVFPVLWCLEIGFLAVVAGLLAVVNVVCYFIWNWKGAAGVLCEGAKSAAGEANLSDLANEYVQCDAEWMSWVIWALIAISGSFQLSVAFSACEGSGSGGGGPSSTMCCCDCGGGGGGFSLGRRAPPHPTTAAHSLSKRRSKPSPRRRKRATRDEEAQLPLQETEEETSSEEDAPPPMYERKTMTVRYGGSSLSEEDEKRSVSRASSSSSSSSGGSRTSLDEEAEVGGRRSVAARR
ncbi:hypothetical protein JCM6882_006503 [Rhodosporidiobolus microsporus]